MTEYLVIYEQADDGGWGAYLPDVPGCITLADSRAEAEVGIRESFALYVEESRRRGQPIPPPTSSAGSVSIAQTVR